MEILTPISIALGLSALAGINLYLTVFALGTIIRLGWLEITPELAGIQLLSHPAVLILAGFLVLIEFVADKIPWVDSIWDGIHTFIRPLGGVLLSLGVVGIADPLLGVLVGLLGGSMAMTTHLSKSTTRLLVNTSPEPFSNTIVSIFEDLLVLSGVGLVLWNPWAAFGLVLLFILLFIWLAPKVVRLIYMTFFYLLKTFQNLLETRPNLETQPYTTPIWVKEKIELSGLPVSSLAWIIPVITNQVPRLPKNRRAYLFSHRAESRIAVILKGYPLSWINLAEVEVHHERKFLYDELGFISKSKKKTIRLRFTKVEAGYLKKLIQEFSEKTTSSVTT